MSKYLSKTHGRSTQYIIKQNKANPIHSFIFKNDALFLKYAQTGDLFYKQMIQEKIRKQIILQKQKKYNIMMRNTTVELIVDFIKAKIILKDAKIGPFAKQLGREFKGNVEFLGSDLKNINVYDLGIMSCTFNPENKNFCIYLYNKKNLPDMDDSKLAAILHLSQLDKYANLFDQKGTSFRKLVKWSHSYMVFDSMLETLFNMPPGHIARLGRILGKKTFHKMIKPSDDIFEQAINTYLDNINIKKMTKKDAKKLLDKIRRAMIKKFGVRVGSSKIITAVIRYRMRSPSDERLTVATHDLLKILDQRGELFKISFDTILKQLETKFKFKLESRTHVIKRAEHDYMNKRQHRIIMDRITRE